jgi:hypothetical protein
MEVNGQVHASAILHPGRESRYKLNRKMVGIQNRFGRLKTRKESCNMKFLGNAALDTSPKYNSTFFFFFFFIIIPFCC